MWISIVREIGHVEFKIFILSIYTLYHQYKINYLQIGISFDFSFALITFITRIIRTGASLYC